jgi:putative ABC transport system ATP-binding protein
MNSIEIRNSSFVYSTKDSKKSRRTEREVLRVENLEIKQGEITFIIGRSGAGKSTLLETIGLMNDTFPNFIPPNMKIDYSLIDKTKDALEYKPKNILLPNIWKETQSPLNQIRLDNFSFIFQQTNLLSNFTAVDNVCITDMLNGHSYTEAYFKSLIIFSLLGLGDLDIDIYPQNISGGQKQRVAFARAIIPDYQFLFGDEPTGNLDRETSIEVLELLSEFIRGANSKTSTIIVSHDIDLALRFADRIIVITKDNIGEIKTQNIFYRGKENAIKKSGIKSFLFKKQIRDAFQNDPNLAENLRLLIDDAKEKLCIEHEIKTQGYIKVDDLLKKILTLIQIPASRSEKIREIVYFDNDFCKDLEKLLKHKDARKDDLGKKEIETDQVKEWKRIDNQSSSELGEKELEEEIRSLLKFEKKEIIFKGGQNDDICQSKNKSSIVLGSFTWLCNVLGKFKPKIKNLTNPLADINNPDFSDLFIKNEGGILLGTGKQLSNFRTLFFALFVTFLGIGFATGSLNYLRDKMDDPFVNFVTTSVPSDKQTEVASIIKMFNQEPEILINYNINVFTGFTIFPLEMSSNKSQDLALITGRTITLNDPLLNELFKNKDNVLAGNHKGFFNEYDCGFIVSEKLLTKLGMSTNARFIKVKIITTDSTAINSSYSDDELINTSESYELVPIPIRAVLKNIPGDLNQDIDFLITDYLRSNLLENHELYKEYPYHPIHTSSLTIYYNTPDSSEAEKFKESLQGILENNPSIVSGYKLRNKNRLMYENYRENLPFEVMQPLQDNYNSENVSETDRSDSLDNNKDVGQSQKALFGCTRSGKIDAIEYPGVQVEIGFMGRKPKYKEIQQMYSSIIDALKSENFDVTELEQLFKPNKRPVELVNTNPRLDRMIIHFKKLDKVEEFSAYLEKSPYKYLRLDMAKIMSMKNYNYVANLTTGIIIFLIALSVYFISYFVANIIANHLDKIRMNIGTLMAFGTSGLKYIYMNLISSYMILTIVTAFFTVWFFGLIYSCRGILWLIYFFRRGFRTDFSLEPGRYFDIFNWWTLIAVLLIFIFSSIMSWRKIKEVLQETPGNLIFGRENSSKS